MHLEWYHYAIALIGSTVAGAINTMAGNGSAITLTILTELVGLPGNMANATNRIGIVAQSAAGMTAFYRNGKLDLSRSWLYIVLMIIGAIGGIIVAMKVSNEQFIQVFRYLMIFMLFVVLVKPERWIRETDASVKPKVWVVIPLFLALGFYGGFIQMGMGIFFLGIMVLGARYSMLDANVVKITVTGIYTTLALVIFALNGLVSWDIGLLMAIGGAIGGYSMAHTASRHPRANEWAHRLLVFVVILSILQLFDVPALLLGKK